MPAAGFRTQAALAARAGVSESQLSQILRGLTWPQPETLDPILEALGLTLEDVYAHPDPAVSVAAARLARIPEERRRAVFVLIEPPTTSPMAGVGDLPRRPDARPVPRAPGRRRSNGTGNS